jgi:hypothetical protein
MIIDNSGTGIASLGRDEDRFVAHVAPGERVVPPVISADTQARLSREMMAAGLDPDEYIVGPHMSINPITGQPEFGWFKKTFKSLKKVAKTVGPVAVNFIPGIGPLAKAALTAGIGKASGLSTKEALLGGALSYGGSKLFGGTPTGGSTPASTGSFFSRAKEFITPGADGVGIFGNVKEFVLPGQDKVGLFGNVKKGIGSLFGGPQQPQLEMGADGNYFDPVTGDVYTYDQLSEMGMLDRSGNLINSPLANLSNRGVGSFFGRETPQFIKSIGDAVGLGGESGLQDFYGGDPSQRGSMQAGGGGMFGGNLGLMGIAGLAGKLAYDASKERMGGIAETPKVTMDQLGRYQMAQNLGTGGSRADFGLAPAPVALQFAKGDVVNMDDYINKMTNELIETYKKDKKYKESSLLPASYIMSDEQEAAQERKKRNMTVSEAIDEYRPSYNLLLMVRKILTGESGDRIPQRKVDEIKNIVRSSIKEKQMNQLGFNMGGIAELDMRNGGESAGPGTGTSDDIPAMLSDGEFVMTAKATRGAGAFDVNKTKSGIELIKGGSASREEGVKNMRELMNIFEAI